MKGHVFLSTTYLYHSDYPSPHGFPPMNTTEKVFSKLSASLSTQVFLAWNQVCLKGTKGTSHSSQEASPAKRASNVNSQRCLSAIAYKATLTGVATAATGT